MAAKRNRGQADNTLPIMDLIYLCLANWHWFLASIVVSLAIAVLYILMTPPIYVSSATVLIKDDSENRASSAAFTTFSENYRSIAEEELKVLHSPAMMIEAINKLNLDVCYTGEGGLHNPIIYGAGLPATLKFLDIGKNDEISLTMHVTPEDEVCMWGFSKELLPVEKGFFRAHDGDTVTTPLGRITVSINHESNLNRERNIFVTRTNINKTIEEFCARYSASFENKNATIVNLRIRDISTQRGRDILNTIIDTYNEQWLADRNQIAVSTDTFLDERIDLLRRELWELDGLIASQKTASSSQESSAAAGSSLLAEKKENEQQLLALTNQQQVVQYLVGILKENKNYLLPGNIGLENVNLQTLVNEYNTTLLRRNSIVQNSSEKNPLVKDYDNRLHKLKSAILTAANTEIEAISSQMRFMRKAETSSNQAISSTPEQAKRLQSILRQQKVKNALYLFLLQKKEENVLSKEYTANNLKVLAAPMSYGTPVAPMKKNAIMLALAIAVMLPMLLIFFKEITYKKIRGRKDLEGLDIPFLGEIPMYVPETKKEAKEYMRGKGNKSILVKHGSRDIINEAFRVLRTNLNFITKHNDKCDVLLLTSFNPGSGKTFLTMNIAASLAMKDDKVLVIDGDMRHGSTSAYISSPSTGISNYLNGSIDDIHSAIVAYEGIENLHILPVGAIPPNPTELLHGEKFGNLIALLRKEYDYIIIDCPPIDIVADTQIIEEHADRTIFVLRTGLLERSMLDELETIYEEKRLKNLSIILNGTYSHGGYHKYGYRYGYRYSYRYGYRYGYKYGYRGDKKKK